MNRHTLRQEQQPSLENETASTSQAETEVKAKSKSIKTGENVFYVTELFKSLKGKLASAHTYDTCQCAVLCAAGSTAGHN